MPGGDGTGPYGAGPRTGRGLGYCTGHDRPGYASRPGFAWGHGWGGHGTRGGGHGRRNWFYRTGLTGWQRASMDVVPQYDQPAFGWGWSPTKEQRVADLKARATYLESALNEVRRDIEDLETAEEA